MTVEKVVRQGGRATGGRREPSPWRSCVNRERNEYYKVVTAINGDEVVKDF